MAFIFWASVVATALTGAGDPVENEKAELAGTWQMVEAERDGSRAPDSWVASRTITFTADGHFINKTGEIDQTGEGEFILNLERMPKTVDLKTTSGPFSGKTLYCIYERTGDELKVCFDTFGTGRPTEFTSGPGSGHFLTVYRRQKAK